jgi:sterol desaturase/sphingolipid hydroxylase (fatty acid hydroxylase superfamily)
MLDDFIIWQCLILGALYFIVSGVLFLLFLLGEKKWILYKIAKKSTDTNQLKREIAYSISTLLIFSALGFFTYFLYQIELTQIYSSLIERGIVYLIVSFLLTLIIHDFYFYWTHRFMHLPCIYTSIHKLHHLSHNTTVFSALSFHPGEALLQVLFIPLIVMIIPLHPVILYSFIIYNLIVNILGHSGYEFFSKSFKKSFVGQFSNTPLYHHTHHQLVKKNYGLYSSIWDKLMGTYNRDTTKN